MSSKDSMLRQMELLCVISCLEVRQLVLALLSIQVVPSLAFSGIKFNVTAGIASDKLLTSWRYSSLDDNFFLNTVMRARIRKHMNSTRKTEDPSAGRGVSVILTARGGDW